MIFQQNLLDTYITPNSNTPRDLEVDPFTLQDIRRIFINGMQNATTMPNAESLPFLERCWNAATIIPQYKLEKMVKVINIIYNQPRLVDSIMFAWMPLVVFFLQDVGRRSFVSSTSFFKYSINKLQFSPAFKSRFDNLFKIMFFIDPPQHCPIQQFMYDLNWAYLACDTKYVESVTLMHSSTIRRDFTHDLKLGQIFMDRRTTVIENLITRKNVFATKFMLDKYNQCAKVNLLKIKFTLLNGSVDKEFEKEITTITTTRYKKLLVF